MGGMSLQNFTLKREGVTMNKFGMNLRLYLVQYYRANGGHRELVSIAYSAYEISEVMEDLQNEYGLDVPALELDEIITIMAEQEYKYGGEWHDGISGGGDWNYYDLSISLAEIDSSYDNLVRLHKIDEGISRTELFSRVIWKGSLTVDNLYQVMTDAQRTKVDKMSDKELLDVWSLNHTNIMDQLGTGLFNDWEVVARAATENIV